MEIITVLADVVLLFFLATLVLTPVAIAEWRKHRAAQRGAQAGQGLILEEFAPVDFSALRDLPREANRPAITRHARRKQSTSARWRVFPPAVPFNYPNIL